MAYSGLADFIKMLEKGNELISIDQFVNPLLEITEITDRISKQNGKALLFRDTGTRFPLLINAYGSERRMLLALGRGNFDEAGAEIEYIFNRMSDNQGSLINKMLLLPDLIKMAGVMPSKSRKKGVCQEVINMNPDLSILPVLKCWPHDGGRFITLPMVHTVHPETGKSNVGMYRMQVLDNSTTAMHWQRHKTGANHFEAWKKLNRKMPVSVALGGDPVYAYSATAPLPENINEYILAGFLRKKKVRLVKCITNDLYVPSDADIILEGYVDPADELVWEGPFGDHTGFYSLADWYPKFHLTCITYSGKAVYPATIVGIPPQEDAWLARATERIFLAPVKMTLQPEIEDFHLPEPGVAHNLMIVKIRKSYPGQGMKVLSSLFGTGQMMFTKYLVAVSGDIDIRNYMELFIHVFNNTDFSKDLLFFRGPLDVLDHASDAFSFGGKLGVDATVKMTEESLGRKKNHPARYSDLFPGIKDFLENSTIYKYNLDLLRNDIPLLILSVDRTRDADIIQKVTTLQGSDRLSEFFRIILVVDHTVDTGDLFTVAWQVLGNSDPQRDHLFISDSSVLIDGTIKAFRKGGFPRKWPNIVCSDNETIASVDQKWNSLGLGQFIPSPSIKFRTLSRIGKDEISMLSD
ncbi:MAG TPA: menaquinone biosynthesis decarboxylase [Bacteroidales bacterium]|nr:MAG: menaquinone biosynthesis decarboxylase [Bacteroidetes bacterium GWC2_40_22]HBH85656.1 menaquinone biosynthesis decarboxylase [Bacteroidales bacterium]